MTIPPALIFDADMVVLDWVAGFVPYMKDRHGILPSAPSHLIQCYGLTEHYPDLTAAEIKSYIAKFSEDGEHFSRIPMYTHVEGVLGELRTHFPDTPFVCVTACGSNPRTRSFRVENLETLKFDAIHTIDLGASKADILNAFKPGCWFVDDHVAHVRDGIAAGHNSVLMHQPYNADENVPYRAMDWHHLFEILTQPPSPSLAS